MSADSSTFRKTVEQQKNELLNLLSQIDVSTDYDIEIDTRDDAGPLSELFVAVKAVADNFRLVSAELQKRVTEADTGQRTDKLFHLALYRDHMSYGRILENTKIRKYKKYKDFVGFYMCL